jgi:hypothetical protein
MFTPESVEAWRWWDSLRGRSVAGCDTQGWANIWIGVMLRRYMEEHPDGLTRFRTQEAWARLIQWQRTSLDHDLPQSFDWKLNSFLSAGGNCIGSNNPWSIRYRAVPRVLGIPGHGGFRYKISEYVLGRVRTLDEDIAFERHKQENRQRAERHLREIFIQKHRFDPDSEDISNL